MENKRKALKALEAAIKAIDKAAAVDATLKSEMLQASVPILRGMLNLKHTLRYSAVAA